MVKIPYFVDADPGCISKCCLQAGDAADRSQARKVEDEAENEVHKDEPENKVQEPEAEDKIPEVSPQINNHVFCWVFDGPEMSDGQRRRSTCVMT